MSMRRDYFEDGNDEWVRVEKGNILALCLDGDITQVFMATGSKTRFWPRKT